MFLSRCIIGAPMFLGRRVTGSFWPLQALYLVVRRPGLWCTALKQARVLAKPGWFTRPPFLPLPDKKYMAFRTLTSTGTPGSPNAREIIIYLDWCKRQYALAR